MKKMAVSAIDPGCVQDMIIAGGVLVIQFKDSATYSHKAGSLIAFKSLNGEDSDTVTRLGQRFADIGLAFFGKEEAVLDEMLDHYLAIETIDPEESDE